MKPKRRAASSPRGSATKTRRTADYDLEIDTSPFCGKGSARKKRIQESPKVSSPPISPKRRKLSSETEKTSKKSVTLLDYASTCPRMVEYMDKDMSNLRYDLVDIQRELESLLVYTVDQQRMATREIALITEGSYSEDTGPRPTPMYKIFDEEAAIQAAKPKTMTPGVGRVPMSTRTVIQSSPASPASPDPEEQICGLPTDQIQGDDFNVWPPASVPARFWHWCKKTWMIPLDSDMMRGFRQEIMEPFSQEGLKEYFVNEPWKYRKRPRCGGRPRLSSGSVSSRGRRASDALANGMTIKAEQKDEEESNDTESDRTQFRYDPNNQFSFAQQEYAQVDSSVRPWSMPKTLHSLIVDVVESLRLEMQSEERNTENGSLSEDHSLSVPPTPRKIKGELKEERNDFSPGMISPRRLSGRIQSKEELEILGQNKIADFYYPSLVSNRSVKQEPADQTESEVLVMETNMNGIGPINGKGAYCTMSPRAKVKMEAEDAWCNGLPATVSNGELKKQRGRNGEVQQLPQINGFHNGYDRNKRMSSVTVDSDSSSGEESRDTEELRLAQEREVVSRAEGTDDVIDEAYRDRNDALTEEELEEMRLENEVDQRVAAGDDVEVDEDTEEQARIVNGVGNALLRHLIENDLVPASVVDEMCEEELLDYIEDTFEPEIDIIQQGRENDKDSEEMDELSEELRGVQIELRREQRKFDIVMTPIWDALCSDFAYWQTMERLDAADHHLFRLAVNQYREAPRRLPIPTEQPVLEASLRRRNKIAREHYGSMYRRMPKLREETRALVANADSCAMDDDHRFELQTSARRVTFDESFFEIETERKPAKIEKEKSTRPSRESREVRESPRTSRVDKSEQISTSSSRSSRDGTSARKI